MPGGQTHAAMNRVACLTYAILAVAHGRIYERCELARELLSLGVESDDLATWVCIAFHESHFDTSANNPYSGDHGIFQISELYWCGYGKACDLPCSNLRDEDISNDLQCALQIREEHTRLQGDGFLAWVVYPQHCKHNTKKYLVDCNLSVKNALPITNPRLIIYENSYFPDPSNYPRNEEVSIPRYLAIGNIVRANHGKILDFDKNQVNWYNYKINNIDDLKLLTSFMKSSHQVTDSLTTTTIEETPQYFPPVVPSRTIESNQFRNKNKLKSETMIDLTAPIDQTSRSMNITTTQSSTSSIDVNTSTSVPITLGSPTTISHIQPISESTTATTHAVARISSRITYKWRPTTSAGSVTSATLKTTPVISTTKQPAISMSKSSMSKTSVSTTNVRTSTTNAYIPRRASRTTLIPSKNRLTMQSTTSGVTTTHLTTTSSITARHSSVVSIDRRPTRTSTHETLTRASSTRTMKPKTDSSSSHYAIESQTTRTTAPTTTIKLHSERAKPRSLSYVTESTTTQKVTTTTHKPQPTQSLFDLYLNPTKAPKLSIPRFLYSGKNLISIKIFANGTTTPVPSRLRNFTKVPKSIILDGKIDMP